MLATRNFRSALYGIFVFAWALAASATQPDGKQLYDQHCAVCHGLDGHGGVGVPLALPAFQSSVSDRYLETTIRLGRNGRVMPAFSSLSDKEIDSIVRYVRSWTEDPSPEFSAERISGNVVRGKSLFLTHCAKCHGDNGEGGPGTGRTFSRKRDFSIMAPALNNPGYLASASDTMIRKTLIEGRADTPMPSFLKNGLSETDINDIVSFVRSFESNRSEEPEQVTEPAILVAESPYSLQETIESVRQAVTGKNFRLIREQYLEDGLVPVGLENKKQVVIYFCNFNFLYDALGLDPRIGIFLPCRVTVAEQDGIVKVMAVNPKHLSTLFNNNELDTACDEMFRIYSEILEEATL